MAIQITYHRKLYLGESIDRKKLDKIKKKLENKPLLSGVFVITIARNPSDQLEIYDAKQLAQKYYEKNPPLVVGIAGSYDEAINTIQQLVKECLEKRGDCALKEYLLCGTSF